MVYPTDLLEQAIFTAALQNYNRDRVVGCGVGFGVSGTDLDEARYLLTSSELDFQNYIPEDPKIPLIVMETSTVAKNHPMVKRLSDIPFSDQKIAFISRETLHYGSPYDYLNVMLEPFWMKVFRKTAGEMWCGGLVGVHGDKCREYIRDWETNGINKYRDSLIFLLAYTSKCREDMANVDQWVIDNYNKSISTRLISSNLIFKAS